MHWIWTFEGNVGLTVLQYLNKELRQKALKWHHSVKAEAAVLFFLGKVVIETILDLLACGVVLVLTADAF